MKELTLKAIPAIALLMFAIGYYLFSKDKKVVGVILMAWGGLAISAMVISMFPSKLEKRHEQKHIQTKPGDRTVRTK